LGNNFRKAYLEYSKEVIKEITLTNTFFLLDNQTTISKTAGIDFIQRHNLADRSILITQDFEDESLQMKCMNLGIKIIPKILLPFIHIQYNKTNVPQVAPTKKI